MRRVLWKTTQRSMHAYTHLLQVLTFLLYLLLVHLPFKTTPSTLSGGNMEWKVGDPVSTGSTTALVRQTFLESASNDSSSQIVSHWETDPIWLASLSLGTPTPYVKEWKQYMGLFVGGLLSGLLAPTWKVVVVIVPEGVSNSTPVDQKRV